MVSIKTLYEGTEIKTIEIIDFKNKKEQDFFKMKINQIFADNDRTAKVIQKDYE